MAFLKELGHATLVAILLAILLAIAATCDLQEVLADQPGYNRALFGSWVDEDNDGLDSREEVLERDIIVLLAPPRPIINGKPVTGFWHCPYTRKLFSNPSKLDVDHVVPLEWAWDHGAYKWPETKRKRFANDMDNLIAVDASANRSKGSKGPEDWLPPVSSYVEDYILQFMWVCDKYELPYDAKLYYELKKKFSYYKHGVKTRQIHRRK